MDTIRAYPRVVSTVSLSLIPLIAHLPTHVPLPLRLRPLPDDCALLPYGYLPAPRRLRRGILIYVSFGSARTLLRALLHAPLFHFTRVLPVAICASASAAANNRHARRFHRHCSLQYTVLPLRFLSIPFVQRFWFASNSGHGASATRAATATRRYAPDGDILGFRAFDRSDPFSFCADATFCVLPYLHRYSGTGLPRFCVPLLYVLQSTMPANHLRRIFIRFYNRYAAFGFWYLCNVYAEQWTWLLVVSLFGYFPPRGYVDAFLDATFADALLTGSWFPLNVPTFDNRTAPLLQRIS